jgi:hypothetical protein
MCTLRRARATTVALEAALLESVESLHEMLASCSGSARPAFVADALALGHVVAVTDEIGAVGYAPTNLGEMHLLDRVASLLAADFLTRPVDYRAVAICDDCGAVSFAWTPCCHHEACPVPVESGVVRHENAPPSSASILPSSASILSKSGT